MSNQFKKSIITADKTFYFIRFIFSTLHRRNFIFFMGIFFKSSLKCDSITDLNEHILVINE